MNFFKRLEICHDVILRQQKLTEDINSVNEKFKGTKVRRKYFEGLSVCYSYVIEKIDFE